MFWRHLRTHWLLPPQWKLKQCITRVPYNLTKNNGIKKIVVIGLGLGLMIMMSGNDACDHYHCAINNGIDNDEDGLVSFWGKESLND